MLIRDEHHKLIPAGSGVWIEKDIVATCFHVIEDSNGPVVVCVLSGTHVNVAAHQISKPQITVLKSAVAETDQASDIALLRVELGGSIMGHNELPIGVMQIGKNVPDTGGGAWLAGYPFGSPALLIRKTAVAGAGILFGPTGLAVVVPAYLVKELQTRLHQH